MARRILRIALIPLLLAALGYGALQLVLQALDILTAYSGPALPALAPGRSSTPVAQRVVVVVVDALREDASHTLPHFQELRQQGADLPSLAGLPSLSWPGYTVLGTGAYPDLSGVASNWYKGSVRVDSVFARAKEAGLSTALVTMAGWDELYGPWATYVYAFPWSDTGHAFRTIAWTTEAIGKEAQRLLRESDVALLYVHFGEVDEAGHFYGADSSEYTEAALHVDAQIAAVAGALDWSRDTLILTADHGMSPFLGHLTRVAGGHGGGEAYARRVPFVMVGRGVVPGTYGAGGQADVAPTVATLLGLPIPAESQGRTRLEALVLTPEQRAEAAMALGEQQRALYDAYLGVLGARADGDGLEEARAARDAGQYARVEGLVRQYLGRLDAVVARAEANRLWRERLVRLPYLLVPLLGAGLLIALCRPRSTLLGPLLLAGLFFLLYWVLFLFVRGHTISFTTVGGLDEAGFFVGRTLDAVVCMGLVAIAAGEIWRRRPWEEVVWQANLVALAIAGAMLLQLGLFLWLYGLHMVWRLPDVGWGFKFYMDLLATVGVGFSAFLFPWVVLGVSRLSFLVARVVGLVKRITARGSSA